MADYAGRRLGNYQLLRLLGQGGFADVYLGTHVYLNTQVAIKVLQTRLTGDDGGMFLNEARTVASLVHPNIVRVLEFGIEAGVPYLVMDYAPNGTLRQLFPKFVVQPPTKILPYVKQMASALQYAHDRMLVHRDIKPENMLLGQNGEVLLSDFGIATIAKTSRSEKVEEAAGTVAYMAPEQLQGRPRAASDQYALGIVVYEWLSGATPFQGTFTEVASQQLFASLPPLRQKVATISPALEAVVARALSKEPRERFASISDFAETFERACYATPVFPAPPVQPASTSNAYLTQPMQTQASIPTLSSSPVRTPPTSAAPTVITPQALPAMIPAPAVQNASATANPSRRKFLFGMAGLVVVAGGSLAWFELAQKQHVPVQPTPVPTQGTQVVHHPTATSTSQQPSPTSSATAIGTTLLTYSGHHSFVYSVAWGPAGKYVASASNDHSVQVWSATTGAPFFSYSHTNAANSVAWSPDGTLIASGGEDKVVRLANANTGTTGPVYSGHTTSVYEVQFSPDSTRIASCSADKTVRVWDAHTLTTALVYTGHASRVWTAAWSPDGMKIASGSDDQTVKIWDAASGTTLRTYSGHSAAVRTVAWSPDGKYIASGGDDQTVQVWDATSGTLLFTFRQHTDRVWVVNWSPDSTRIVSGSKDATAQVWDALSGNHLFVYRHHSATVFDAAWSPGDGKRIVSGSTDTTVQIWQAV